MRILSPFKDYYDTAMAHGSDQSRVFVRNPETSELKLDRDGDGVWDRYGQLAGIADAFELRRGGVCLDACVVLFCGRIYKALRVHRLSSEAMKSTSGSKPSEVEERIFYDGSEARHYLEGLLGPHWMKKKRQSFLEYDNPLANGTLAERLERYFQQQGSAELMQWSVENRTAIAVLRVGGRFEKSFLKINPPLKNFQFYRLFGPVEAFQELDMFWGGVLALESRPTLSISDKDRIAQHGFNARSFRKDPSKKR
ncbi:hypothetical protein PPGU19_092840 (plasmid) [Paraburkholderia sp. PGU19]|uniref:hypothetical protein n=1 Tax=Paraburkholderia sp. PGU19 TaxID=2735434 RepID=UPI0015DA211E|nr:hypothetical protein [Paraburkholderia sp. PGU19]BCG04716.1 hypothetical protein PPGU19_092840 [Paraburkholderia sp. PGU19]